MGLSVKPTGEFKSLLKKLDNEREKRIAAAKAAAREESKSQAHE